MEIYFGRWNASHSIVALKNMSNWFSYLYMLRRGRWLGFTESINIGPRVCDFPLRSLCNIFECFMETDKKKIYFYVVGEADQKNFLAYLGQEKLLLVCWQQNIVVILVERRNKVQGYMYQIYLDGHYKSIFIISSFLQISQCFIDAQNSTCFLWLFGCYSVIFSFSVSWILVENYCNICTATGLFLSSWDHHLMLHFRFFYLKYVFKKPVFVKKWIRFMHILFWGE